jgi:hypothetical protein
MTSLKPDGGEWKIREQIVEDLVTGLTFQFEVNPANGLFYFRIFGEALPLGNREILFDQNGNECGAGTFMAGGCKPTWMTEVA